MSVERTATGLRALYRIEGDLARVRIPPPAPPRRADGLWRHTCCELFISRKGSEAYEEFNFSPSGEWAAYAFESYRKSLGNVELEPRIQFRKGELEAQVDIKEQPLEIAVSTVIEDVDGKISYWALRHVPGKPDFHHREAFALEIE